MGWLVTSLAREGVAGTPEDLLSELAPALTRRLAQDASSLCADYLAATELAGAPVRVGFRKDRLAGTLHALDLQRGLGLRTGDGLRWLDLAHVRGLDREDGEAATTANG